MTIADEIDELLARALKASLKPDEFEIQAAEEEALRKVEKEALQKDEEEDRRLKAEKEAKRKSTEEEERSKLELEARSEVWEEARQKDEEKVRHLKAEKEAKRRAAEEKARRKAEEAKAFYEKLKGHITIPSVTTTIYGFIIRIKWAIIYAVFGFLYVLVFLIVVWYCC